MRRVIFFCWFALTLGGATSAASAFTVDSVGDAFRVSFDGIIDGALQPGLSASADFKVTAISYDGSLDKTRWDLDVILKNTSTSPITASRVSVLGFDTDPDPDVDASSVTGIFNNVADGNVAQLGAVEVCFKNTSGNGCSGGGGSGVEIGEVGLFTAMLYFHGEISNLALSNFAVRYQSIEGGTGGTSGSGRGTATVIPLPGAALLFLSGCLALAGLGWRVRW